jgi:hypothetical protein
MSELKSMIDTDTGANITFKSDSTEMLRIAKDGFYIRGIRINQDDNESEIVYNAFHRWLTWATLTRDY